MLLLAVVDDRRRFIYIQHSDSARASDMRAQQAKRLLARARGQADLDESLVDLTFFNTQAAKARVTVEQAFGILKARVGILRSANTNWRAVLDVDDLQDIMHEERETWIERLRHEDYFKQFPEQYRRREEVVREMQKVDERRWAL
nr:hypothetical protein L203_02082 [Cryptococcus depauperatus CBS 7841]